MNETSYERLRNSAVDHGLRFKENRTGDAMMQCPVHTPDNTPSVHVTYKPGKGVTLLHDMHDDNATGDILRELGMSESDLYDTPKQAIRHDSRRNRDIGESVRALARVREQEAALAVSWKPAGPYTMPQCVPYDEATLTKTMTDLWEALGMPLVGGTSTCPICNAGTLHMAPIHAPNGEYATGVLLSCTSCAPKALYDHLAQNLRITTTRMSISDTHVFITDTTNGFTFTYEDGLTVVRKGDGKGGKTIFQTGERKGGKHVPYLLTPSTEHAKHTGVIFITEGEKDAAAMLCAGFAAISTTGGGGNVANTLNIDATVQALAGLNVVAICDKDTTGDKWRQALYDLLTPHVNDHGLQSLTFIQACEPCHDAGDAVALGRFEFERVHPVADTSPADSEQEQDYEQALPFVETNAFWQQTPYLREICQASREHSVAPACVLGDVLARTAAMLPPQVVTPAYVGSKKGSLNFFTAVVGGSGDGKGTAAGVAEDLVPDLFGAREEKPSSGESLASLYTQWASEENPQDPKKPIMYHACANPRALLNIPEVSWFAAVSDRKGSTMGGELASAFVAEPLGGVTKDHAKTLTTPAHGYRMGAIIGVQYANADALFNMSGTGVPQRFLWVDTVDHDMPRTPPPETAITPLVDRDTVPDVPAKLQALYRAGSMGAMIGGEAAWEWVEMKYPPEVRELTNAIRYERNEKKKRGEDDGDNLEGHLNFVRIKVAGLLPWLDRDREDHTQVTSEDWRIAGQIIEYSCHVRDKCRERYLQTVRDNRAEYETVRKGAQDDAERNLAMIRQETPGKVVAFLSKRGRKGKPFKGTDIARNISRKWRHYVYEALDELCEQGMVQRVEDTGASTTSTWAIFK